MFIYYLEYYIYARLYKNKYAKLMVDTLNNTTHTHYPHDIYPVHYSDSINYGFVFGRKLQ